MDQKSSDLSIEEKKAAFRKAAITHCLLEQTDRAITRAIAEPAGFAFVLVHGPTGVGKTRMIEIITERMKRPEPSLKVLPSHLQSLSGPDALENRSPNDMRLVNPRQSIICEAWHSSSLSGEHIQCVEKKEKYETKDARPHTIDHWQQ
jgi:hypothetical protein